MGRNASSNKDVQAIFTGLHAGALELVGPAFRLGALAPARAVLRCRRLRHLGAGLLGASSRVCKHAAPMLGQVRKPWSRSGWTPGLCARQQAPWEGGSTSPWRA